MCSRRTTERLWSCSVVLQSVSALRRGGFGVVWGSSAFNEPRHVRQKSRGWGIGTQFKRQSTTADDSQPFLCQRLSLQTIPLSSVPSTWFAPLKSNGPGSIATMALGELQFSACHRWLKLRVLHIFTWSHLTRSAGCSACSRSNCGRDRCRRLS